MKKMSIIELNFNHFQGGTFSLKADGGDCNCFGQNGAGKTRIYSAFTYLLYGKDSLGRSDFSLKDLDATGAVAERGIDHFVEAVLDVDGQRITISKTFREKWVKTRGKATAEFSGHETLHAIDGVPLKEMEYKARITEIFGDETTARLLTSPTVFPSLPWQKARSILLEICGDISDADIIASDDTLTPLTAALAKYTVSKTPLDDLKKVTMGRRTEINKQIDQIPVRIDEARRALPDVTGLDKSVLETEIQALEAELNNAKLRLAGVDTGGKIAPLTKELNGIIAEISGLENAHYLKQSESVTRLNQQIRALSESREADERKLKSVKAEIEEKTARMASLDKSMDTLREKWDGIDGEEFQDSTESVCAACGQSLPEDKVEAAREKARASFNTSKSERLAYVQSEGKRLAAEKTRISGEVNHPEDLISVPLNTEKTRTEIDRLTTERDAAKASASYYSGIPGRQDLLDRKVAIEKAINEAKGSVAEDRAIISQEIAAIKPKLAEAQEKSGRFDYLSVNEKRIKDLKAEEKKLAGEFEGLEKLLFLIETFIKKKVSLLTDRINEKFKVVSFRLFNQLVNGGLEECCVFTVNGVPYDGGLNAAARTQGGLDIIRTLQGHYGIAPTVFIDNRESVSEIPEMDCQIVNLIVSPQDKVLRVERAERVARRAAA